MPKHQTQAIFSALTQNTPLLFTITAGKFYIFAIGLLLAASIICQAQITIAEYPVPTSSSIPTGITTGPDGNLWFADESGNQIGRITTAGVVTMFSIPTSGSQPIGIALGPDGNLWFAEQNANQLGRITTAGVITEFSVPTNGSVPQYLTTGPDGNLWFTEDAGNKIGRLTGIFAQLDGPYQIGYAANLNIGDSVVNLTNDGVQGGFYPNTGGAGNVCINVYAFDPQEEEIACCSCLVTPNGLNSLSVKTDLINNTLTLSIPDSIVVKLVSSVPAVDPAGSLTVCDPAAGNGPAIGMLAWGATLEPAAGLGTYAPVNVPYINGTLNTAANTGELSALTTVCQFIQSQGSNFGICSSCGTGGLAGAKK